MKKFLQNKSIGYFIAAADAVLALVLAILFFATYKGAVTNTGRGLVPEIIGIFALGGMAIEIVALLLPEYSFIHLGALLMYGISLGKQINLVPDLIAGKINNVEYEGGDFTMNIIWLVLQLVLVGTAVAVAFLGMYKKQEEADADFKNIKGTAKLVKMAGGAALVLAAVLSTTILTANLNAAAARGSQTVVEEGWSPINDEIRAAAEAKEYDFDPTTVIIKEEESYDYNASDLKNLKYSKTRSGHNLVYYFEGSYAEGYQGDYSETYADIYLWDDGLYAGKAKDTEFKGYWYNSSIRDGADEEGNDIADCLNMVGNVSKYESIITEPASGFYERQAYIYLNMGWGTRSIIVSGYKYYPEVALAINPGSDKLETKVGESIDVNSWVAVRVLKNLTYSAVFKKSEVTWTIPAELKKTTLETAGEYEVKAKWGNFQAAVTVKVNEA